MHKKLFILLFVMMAANASVTSVANPKFRDPRTEITIHSINVRTRSIEVLPGAYISGGILSVSFDASGVYSLYIEDSMGHIVYTSTLPANGMEYNYDLSGIGEGTFRLTLEGPLGEYGGYFILNQ